MALVRTKKDLKISLAALKSILLQQSTHGFSGKLFSLFQLSPHTRCSIIPPSLELFQALRSFWGTSSFPFASPGVGDFIYSPHLGVQLSDLWISSNGKSTARAIHSWKSQRKQDFQGRRSARLRFNPLHGRGNVKKEKRTLLKCFMHTKAAAVCGPWGIQMLLVSY